MANPRVLHLIGSLEPGGTERQLVEFLRRSTERSDHRVVVFDRPGSLVTQLPCSWDSVGPIRRGWGGAPTLARAVVDLRRSMQDSPVDLVHAHLGSSQVLAAAAAPWGVPIVATRRGRTPILEGGLGRGVLAAANRRTSVIICNSQELANDARREPGVPADVVVIRNGVDLSSFTPSTLPSGPPTVVVVARMRPEKGHDLFLRAFRRTVDEVPTARAILVGGGPSSGQVHRTSAELGLEHAVSFVGEVADPRPYLARAHVVALSSPHEGFPNALLEGMASGRAVVATSVGGVPELVRDGLDGRLTSCDAQAFADALSGLLTDPAACVRMGEAARARALGFTWDDVVDRTNEVYARVRAGRRSSMSARAA